MLERDELVETAAVFGVAEEQVVRDHLISHVLFALADLQAPVIFFGGTALARTHLTDPGSGARLSEDIDLYGTARRETAALLDEQLPRRLRREFPRSRWDPALLSVRSSDTAQLVTSEGVRLRIQLLDSGGNHHDYAHWPVEGTPVRLRYRDLPDAVQLRTPTLAAFAAMKTAAWADRYAARDLYDLAALARVGALTHEAADLFKAATGVSVTRDLFRSVAVTYWEEQLAHQTQVLPTAEECLVQVRDAYAEALDWPPTYDPFQ
jgi:predicted nucleotidyltransferase component of viral defense system